MEKEAWPIDAGGGVVRLVFVHPALQQLLAAARVCQVPVRSCPLCRQLVSGREHLLMAVVTQTAEGAHLLLDCSKMATFRNKSITNPPG